jgi:hypothetical protein
MPAVLAATAGEAAGAGASLTKLSVTWVDEVVGSAAGGSVLPKQEIVGSYIELGSTEAITAERVYWQARNSSETLVIGRLQDTAAGAELGMRRLNEPTWSINVNDAWIQGGIDGGKPFYLGSNISIGNLRSGNPMYPKTVFFRELEQLKAAGYIKQGDWMYPPVSR